MGDAPLTELVEAWLARSNGDMTEWPAYESTVLADRGHLQRAWGAVGMPSRCCRSSLECIHEQSVEKGTERVRRPHRKGEASIRGARGAHFWIEGRPERRKAEDLVRE